MASAADVPMAPMLNYMNMANPGLMVNVIHPFATRPPPRVPEEPKLHVLKEVAVTKHAEHNVLSFQVKAGAGVLYSILQPPSLAYESPDTTWLQLLEAVALIPSGRPAEIRQLLVEAYRILPVGDFRALLGLEFRNELEETMGSTARDGVLLKNKINVFLRTVLADPIHGYPLAKHHVHDGFFVDDVIITPAGRGYVRAYRPVDGFFVVLYPYGHGYIHEASVRRVPSKLLTSHLH
ncbi:hypothetical protein ACHHYP_05383 [Achlya hypogyna]|uniref:Uncharacterized protein n=1 Tax=Achlya hypogyna TaxID=1202772 RepID=A0A1V9YXW9_ACHHY|nr:hypothetical protein ACHHYP_05383 [Achlya hypogyna]